MVEQAKNPEEAYNGDEPPEDLRIDDPEDYLTHRRLKEIFDSKKEIREKRKEIDLMVSNPEFPTVDRDMGAKLYRTPVEDFITTLEPLLVQKYPEKGTQYWSKENLGEIAAYPPKSLTENNEPSVFNGHAEVVSEPKPQVVKFNGLSSVLDAERPLTFEFKAEVKDLRSGQTDTERQFVQKVIPWSILVNAVRLGTLFLSEIGVEAELSDNTGGASFDYRDIVEDRLGDGE